MSNFIDCGVLIGCGDSGVRAGNFAIYIADKPKIVSFTPSATDHSYTAVTLDTSADLFYKFNFYDGTLSSENAATRNLDNGSINWEATIEGFAPSMDKDKGDCYSKLNAGCGFVVIVATASGKAFVFGYDEFQKTDLIGMQAQIGSISEAPFDGQQGYTFSLIGRMFDNAREFVGTIETDQGQVTFPVS